MDALRNTRTLNNEVAWCIVDAMNDESLSNEQKLSLIDRALSRLGGGITRLDASRYREDPYYKKVKFEDQGKGSWKLTHYSYSPKEPFVCNDITLTPDLQEIPRIGYFDEEFTYPAVEQDSREWMAVKPNEVETMAPHIGKVSGRVAAFGLGIGYFPFMASLKENVESVTVYEKDPQAIALFEEFIHPQFPFPGKVKVEKADAFDVMEKGLNGFDYAFVDLWHDTSDGLNPYLKSRRLERRSPEVKFLYWVEESLLSALRWEVFDAVLSKCRTRDEAIEKLSDKGLGKMIASAREKA